MTIASSALAATRETASPISRRQSTRCPNCRTRTSSAPRTPLSRSPLRHQPANFANAVVEITTGLEPQGLLGYLHGIEDSMGRVRDVPNGPRTIDLDICYSARRR